MEYTLNFPPSIFTNKSINGQRRVKNKKCLGIHDSMIHLLHLQPVTLRCLNLVSWWPANGHNQLTQKAERQPGKISCLHRYKCFQNHFHQLTSLILLADVHSSSKSTVAQLQARNKHCSSFSEAAMQYVQYFQGSSVTWHSKINSVIKQHHMSFPPAENTAYGYSAEKSKPTGVNRTRCH